MPSFSSVFPLFVLLAFFHIVVHAHPSPGPEHAQTWRTVIKRDAFSDTGLSLASWIWLKEPDLLTTAPAGAVAFIKSFNTPSNKTAATAQIAITVDNNFTLYVNGQPVGASLPLHDAWEDAQVFSVALNASTNIFSVLGINDGFEATPSANPAGLLAAIRVQYTDGSNETVLSDDTWLVSGTVPADFPLPANLSPFTPAEVATKYGAGPWGTSISLPSTDSSPLNLTGSAWVWSISNAGTNAPVGNVGFRKTIVAPSGKTASWATAILSVDNSFDFYVNGLYIGSPPFDNNAPTSSGSWRYAQRFNVSLNPSTNVFTVVGKNFPSQTTGGTSGAGLIAALLIKYTDGSSDIVRTNTTWLTGTFTSLSSFLATADSTLVSSISQGSYGVAPWGDIGISDALNALQLPGNNAVSPVVPTTTNTPTILPTSTNSLPRPASTTTLPTPPTLTSSDSPTSPTTGGARPNINDHIAPSLVFALYIMMFF
ncbi:hypothetical protein B0H19DRAFT_424819 [Mycena capillaripes]|nr:hypothetical protein B0H19DRAFT_424819 [Mycena capillaripes]